MAVMPETAAVGIRHCRARVAACAVAAAVLATGCSGSSSMSAPTSTTPPAAQPRTAATSPPAGGATTPAAAGSPSPGTTSGNGSLQGSELLAALREGGRIIYLRHGATEADDDAAEVDLRDRNTQRNLSDEGRRQAEAIGAGIDKLDIPIGKVVASPYARAVETAQIAFGRAAVTTDEDLVYPYYQGVDRGALALSLRRMLDQEPAPGTNTVLVGHGDNLVGAARVEIEMGTAAVIDPRGDELFAVIGTVSPYDWSKLSR